MLGEAHNPQAIRAPDGMYLLMDSYNGPDAGCPNHVDYTTCKPVNCTLGAHGGGCGCPPKMPHNGTNGGLGSFTFHVSSTSG